MFSGGSHTGDVQKHTGHCGLGAAVRYLGLETNEAVEIDFVVRCPLVDYNIATAKYEGVAYIDIVIFHWLTE